MLLVYSSFASDLIVVAGCIALISFIPESLALSTWAFVCDSLILVTALFLAASTSCLALAFSSSVASLLLVIKPF